MSTRLAMDFEDRDDLISRNLLHCACCHQDLDRAEDFTAYSDDDIDDAVEGDEVIVYCDRCNPCQCTCELAFDIYEPKHGDKLVPCTVCGIEQVIFGSKGW